MMNRAIVSANLAKLTAALALLILLLAHMGIHQPAAVEPRPDKTANVDSGWIQPSSLSSTFPEAVGNLPMDLNFQRIESQLLAFQNQGLGIEANPILLSLFKDVSTLLNEQSDAEKARFKLLIRKALPLQSGEDFMILIERYLSYVANEQMLLEKISQASPLNKPTLLKNFKSDITQLQLQHFDEHTARRLFTRQNLTSNYFYQRQLIRLQTELAPTKKQAMLDAIEKEYKTALDELE